MCSTWEPCKASDASSDLSHLCCLTKQAFHSQNNKTVSYTSNLSVTINNRSSLLNPIIGPVRCYLRRTRLSFGFTKKYMNKCIKCPSVLRSARIPLWCRVTDIPGFQYYWTSASCVFITISTKTRISSHLSFCHHNPKTWNLFFNPIYVLDFFGHFWTVIIFEF